MSYGDTAMLIAISMAAAGYCAMILRMDAHAKRINAHQQLIELLMERVKVLEGNK